MITREIISPLQKWLLAKGRCICCGRFLGQMKGRSVNGEFLVTCVCKKSFLYQIETDTFQKAPATHEGL